MNRRNLPDLLSPKRLTLLICLLSLVFVPAAVRAEGPQKVATIEGITEYRLDNGLRVLLYPDPATSNVTVNLTVFVGSRHEGYGETGMAHLLEHMLFKGTPTHPDVPKVLKDHGANYNGTTWVDRTNYFESMPATDANLEFALKLEADRMVNSFVRRDDLASEMTVVRSEFEQGENSPQRILSQRMMATAFEWHNYGKSTIGNRTDIERVPIDRLQGFYKKYYRPDNAMLVVGGKFDEKKALELITKYFAGVKNPTAKPETTYTEEPAQDGERLVTLRRVGKVGVIGAVYHVPAAAHEDFAAVEMLNSILTARPSGRLYQALVPTKKANSVSGAAYGWHDPGVLEIGVEVDPAQSLDEARDAMLRVLEGAVQEKFTAEEVDRAKNQFKSNFDLLLPRSNSVAVTLSEWGAKGDWRLFFLHRDRVAKVTPEDVSRVARKYLQRNNRTLGMFIPTEKGEQVAIPSTPSVADLVKDYKGGQAVVAGEAFEPSPENIDKRTQRQLPPTGPKAALLPKKSGGETVALYLTLYYGNEKSLHGQNGAAGLLPTMMMRGTTKHTRQQLQDQLAKLGARVLSGGGVGSITFSVECKKQVLPEVLALLGEVLRQPSFPADEFEILKRENADQVRKGLTDPRTLASRLLQRQLNPYSKDDIRYVTTLEESLARLEATTLEQVKQLHAKQVGGQWATVAIVGDFSGTGEAPDKVKPVSELLDLLGGWKSDVAYERIARPAPLDTKGGREVIRVPDKKDAYFVAGHNLAITDHDPDYAALEIANYLFGGGSLSSRLGTRIRQKEGLSYGAGSSFTADARDKAGRFQMGANCNPDSVERVDKAVMEELDRILKDGISAQELAEAQKGYLEHLKTMRASDRALASSLNDLLDEGRTFAYQADLEKKIAALTPAEVNAAVRKHWQPGKLVIVRSGDFKEK